MCHPKKMWRLKKPAKDPAARTIKFAERISSATERPQLGRCLHGWSRSYREIKLVSVCRRVSGREVAPPCCPGSFMTHEFLHPSASRHQHVSGDANYLPKFQPISFFRRASRFYRCFGTFGPPIRKILVYTGMLPCLAP